MNPKLKSQIDRIFQAYAEWWKEGPIPPATEEQIAQVADWFTSHHPGQLPTDLADFWRTTNGIDLDGVVLWATDSYSDEDIMGVVDINELYIENFPEYFFLGKSDDIWMYAYDPAARKFRILAMFEFDTIEAEYDTFDELASHALAEAMDGVDLT